MRLALIPARGGSKRIPRKNIKIFHGMPMIAWTIKAAKESMCFDRIMVSTDDAEIADIARSNGAEVPFIRPAELSDDQTNTIDVVQHAINWWVEHVEAPSLVCCLYATAPFIRTEDLLEGLRALDRSDVMFAFSATRYAFPVQRAIRRTEGGGVEMLMPEHFLSRSQDLEELYHDAGQFYWGRTEAWLSSKSIFSSSSVLVPLPRYRVQDIDTMEDWFQAELMFRQIEDMDGSER